jgi:hypothetical protein
MPMGKTKKNNYNSKLLSSLFGVEHPNSDKKAFFKQIADINLSIESAPLSTPVEEPEKKSKWYDVEEIAFDHYADWSGELMCGCIDFCRCTDYHCNTPYFG